MEDIVKNTNQTFFSMRQKYLNIYTFGNVNHMRKNLYLLFMIENCDPNSKKK